LSILNVAALVEMNDNSFKEARIALGAVAPTPLRIEKAEEFLRGKTVGENVIDEAAQIVKDK